MSRKASSSLTLRLLASFVVSCLKLVFSLLLFISIFVYLCLHLCNKLYVIIRHDKYMKPLFGIHTSKVMNVLLRCKFAGSIQTIA
jgi:hypothetical protein